MVGIFVTYPPKAIEYVIVHMTKISIDLTSTVILPTILLNWNF